MGRGKRMQETGESNQRQYSIVVKKHTLNQTAWFQIQFQPSLAMGPRTSHLTLLCLRFFFSKWGNNSMYLIELLNS